MTREEAKELLPIIQAFAEGKMIEIYDNREWQDLIIGSIKFDCKPSCYRIKPEPKYRPFRSREECWDEMMKHQPFGWVKEISSEMLYLINGISDMSIVIMEDISSFEEAMNIYEFNDGAPFGIKEK